MKDNSKDELSYNDLWRENNKGAAAGADVLKIVLSKHGCTHLHKLVDWKLMMYASMMQSYSERYHIPHMAMIHLLDMFLATLECQTEEQTQKLAADKLAKAIAKKASQPYKGFL